MASLDDLERRVAQLEAALRRKTRLGDFAFLDNLSVTGTLDATRIVSGTWTPGWAGTGTAGTFTYTVRLGYYVAIGQLVFINARINISAIGTPPTGNLTMTGLPFTSANTSNLNSALSPGFISQFNLSAGCIGLLPLIQPNRSIIDFFEYFDNAGGANFAAGGLNATAQIVLSGCYRRA